MESWIIKQIISDSGILHEYPVLSIIIFVILWSISGFMFYKGIPFLIKWKFGVIQKEKQAKESTRKNVEDLLKSGKMRQDKINAIDEKLTNQNGSIAKLNEHIKDKDIHMDFDKLAKVISDKLSPDIKSLRERVENLKDDIKDKQDIKTCINFQEYAKESFVRGEKRMDKHDKILEEIKDTTIYIKTKIDLIGK